MIWCHYYWSKKKNSYDPSLRMVWPQMFYPQHGALMVASTAAHKSAGFGLKIRWQSQSEKLDWRFPHFCLGIHWLIFTNSNSVHLRPRRSSECNADCPSAPTLDEVTTSPPWSQIYAPSSIEVIKRKHFFVLFKNYCLRFLCLVVGPLPLSSQASHNLTRLQFYKEY